MTTPYTTEPVASAYTTEPRLPVVVSNERPMPAEATGRLFMLASGFGIGALVVLGAFMFLIGIGGAGQHAMTPANAPAAQSAANAPAGPGPAPRPAPNTGGNASAPTTTGQAPAPADPQTPRAPTQQQAR
jgi:hypothetical protein